MKTDKKIALIAGTFDPITLGHLDIIKRTAAVFDEVVVGIFENPAKKKLFSAETRICAVECAIKDIENARAVMGDGFVGEFAKREHCSVIVKGARDGKDFEYEKLQADYHKLHFNVETLILFSADKFSHLSSTTVREALLTGADVSEFLPCGVYDILKKSL